VVNVRVDDDRWRKIRRLRDHGITASDVFRDAIDQRYDALRDRREARDAGAVLASIFAAHPDPSDTPRRDDDVHDAAQARPAVRRRISRRR
jgi:hypothetical protein